MARKSFALATCATLFVGIFLNSVVGQSAPPPPRPWGGSATPGQSAQTQPSARLSPGGPTVETSTGKTMAPQAPGAVGFVVPEVKPREPETGWSVGVYGGPNLGQFADGANSNFSSNIHGAGGVKLAYTWPFDEERTDQFQDEFGGFRLSGAVELDAGYVGNRLSGNAFGVVPYSADLDSAVFVVNFLLKGQVGNFRPYIGPGIGAAFHSASNFRVNGLGNGSDEDISFAFQGVIGTDYFITPEWSIFTEYRLLAYQSLGLFSTPQLSYDRLYSNLVTFGVRHNF